VTRIDFYILDDQTVDASRRFACRLSAKAFQAGQSVHIHVQDADERQIMDELLWDYPKHRFLPHEVVTDTPSSCPIQIGSDAPHLDVGLLINLTQQVPKFFGRFDRVAEVVVGENRDAGRDRYKHYRDRGCPLHHHNLSDWEYAD
jgi:DNA polymerase-3 subunit chi